MNKLKLKEATQEYVVYLYSPEGKDGWGEIRVNIGSDDAAVISRSGNDNSEGYYAFKAAKAVKKCVAERNFPLEFTQAWY